jgi:predicted ATPase
VKLDWLKVPRYRNLVDFEINFDDTQATTVVLGQNGKGKSNLLEALVEIFRDLELNERPPFAYEVQYYCREYKVRIVADPAKASSRMQAFIDDKEITAKTYIRDRDKYLPNYVFAYYSGWSSRLESQFLRTTREHYQAVLNSKDDHLPLRRLFFCRREYSQLVLLAFFLDTSQRAKELLAEYLQIDCLESALFVLKKPDWGKSGLGDSLFWSARGAFQGFLGRLWRTAIAPIRRSETVERDVRRKGERIERQYLYIKDQAALTELAGEGGAAPTTLFGYLEGLFLCDLVDEVRVTVRRKDGVCVKFAQLSEGEQQLLTVLGLLLFTQNDEALYLLDEPDTHLNPVWTYDYLKVLQENIRTDKGQLLIATHNPLMIGSLHRNQVRVLAQDGGKTVAKEPDYDPIGVGIEGLLKSELYGLRSTLAPAVLEKIDRQYLLLGTPNKNERQQRELMELGRELNSLAVATSHPNPYFETFAKQLAARQSPPKKLPSATDIVRQTELAKRIVEELDETTDAVGKDELSA